MTPQETADAEMIGRDGLHPPCAAFVSTGAARTTQMLEILRSPAGWLLSGSAQPERMHRCGSAGGDRPPAGRSAEPGVKCKSRTDEAVCSTARARSALLGAVSCAATLLAVVDSIAV